MLDNREEVRLWRQAMEHLHGAEWLEELSLQFGGRAAQRAVASGPAASADPGAAADATPAAAAAAGRVSPGSGDQARAERSPGSGERTAENPPRSWHSSIQGRQ